MAKKANKRKKQDIIMKSLQNCFRELEIPLEVVNESKERIILISPIVVNEIIFHVTVALQKKIKIVTIIISNPEKIKESHLCTLIEFANRLNKMYSTLGYLAVDAETRFMNMHYAVELLDEKIDRNRLKKCFKAVLGDAAKCFGFVESRNVENSTCKDLMTQYIAYNEGR